MPLRVAIWAVAFARWSPSAMGRFKVAGALFPSPTRLGSAPRPRLGAAGYVNHPDPHKEGTTDERISSRG